MKNEPIKVVEDVWIALMKAQNSSMNFVEAELKRNGLPSFSWYDILWELDKAGTNGLRPFELERGLLITQYGTSRLLSRMEKANYLIKEVCSSDARGHTAFITEEGKKIRQDMWKIYSKAIQVVIGNKLNEYECKALSSLLTPLAESQI